MEVLEEILEPIRQRRSEYEKNPAEVMKILERGTQEANAKAAEVLRRVKRGMHIDYFNE